MHPLTFRIYPHIQTKYGTIAAAAALLLIKIAISCLASARVVNKSSPFKNFLLPLKTYAPSMGSIITQPSD
jgi:hypothetical protein